MTNEYIAAHFEITWNGKPNAYLCVQRDEDVIRRERVVNIFAERDRFASGQRKSRVLDACDDVWRGRHEIAARCGLEANAVSSDLYKLYVRKLVKRSRTQNTPWLYRRVTPEAGQ